MPGAEVAHDEVRLGQVDDDGLTGLVRLDVRVMGIAEILADDGPHLVAVERVAHDLEAVRRRGGLHLPGLLTAEYGVLPRLTDDVNFHVSFLVCCVSRDLCLARETLNVCGNR